MPLPPLYGHSDVRRQIARAAASGHLAQSMLLHGSPGIGKERMGLWIAQLLMCEDPSPETGPCDVCAGCRLTLRLEHPDVHWFFPLARPEGASGDRLRQKLEDARSDELARRRGEPNVPPSHERTPALFLALIQSLHQLASVRPSMGSQKVFVVGDAETMVPQESSPEAANAFLKLLEEPPAGTTIVITSSQPGALLPTIRSRVLPIRMTPLADEELIAFLVQQELAAAAAAEKVAPLAQGAIGRAIRLVDGGGGALEEQRQAGRTLLLAALSEGGAPRLAAANSASATGGRGEFQQRLDALAGWLRDLLAVATASDAQLLNSDGRDMLQRAVDKLDIAPLAIARALDSLDEARDLALGNVNPQLVLAELLRALQSELRPASPSSPRRA